ncbi:MAG: polysaccharide deacetylase [Ruminococcaceae bacterium]|nr:polysaccharide deacetylase [Oscillospiraceae bacterium]
MNNITMKFPGGLLKALTLSYDDAVIQDIPMIELMQKYGIKGTFNINSGLFADEEYRNYETKSHCRMTKDMAYETYANSGMEIAVHGVRHLSLSNVTTEEAYNDVYYDRDNLEKMFGHPIHGMAYAYCAYNDTVIEILKKCGIYYSRAGGETRRFDLPENWLVLHPTCHHDDPKLPRLTDEFISADPEKPMMFYLWGHTYEFARNENWNVIIEFFEKIHGRDDIWYATNIEIYNYVKAFESLDFTVEGSVVYNPTALDVWFSADGKDYCVKSGETITL